MYKFNSIKSKNLNNLCSQMEDVCNSHKTVCFNMVYNDNNEYVMIVCCDCQDQ